MLFDSDDPLASRSDSSSPPSSFSLHQDDYESASEFPAAHTSHVEESSTSPIKLNIVIQTIGTQGDIQPFLILGQELHRHGHRVRLATHSTYADAIAKTNPQLDFFPIGGDPIELISYGRQNDGYIHELKTLQARLRGEKIPIMSDIIEGCWRSCVDDDPATGAPFVADAIIASPIAFSHVHCAQALGGIPVHLMYTMPWSKTRAFPHAITRVGVGRAMKPGLANWMSYWAIEWMMWLYLGDTINQLRASLDLHPVPMKLGPGLHETLKIPFTYFWSPALVPKPDDWASHIEVSGYINRDPPSYEPPPELQQFLHSGSTPIYVGFGSIMVDEHDAQQLTETVLAAISLAGVRAVVAKGWCKLGTSLTNSENVFFIGDCSHEWLFQHVSLVVHHGGLGTTICGLANERPTAVVPFVADGQRFWGHVVAGTGAGPAPIPYTSLSPRGLAAAIRYCLTDQAKAAARQIGSKVRAESSGSLNAVQSFHRTLPVRRMQCDILSDQPAVWSYRSKDRPIQLSKPAAWILIHNGMFNANELHMHKMNTYEALEQCVSPSIVGIIVGFFLRVLSVVFNPVMYFLCGGAKRAKGPPPSKLNAQQAVVDARLREGKYVAEKMSPQEHSNILKRFASIS